MDTFRLKIRLLEREGVDFLGFSYGFRPGRSPHLALDALAVGIGTKKVNWVLDAEIRRFYDTFDHGWLVKFVEHRIADRHVVPDAVAQLVRSCRGGCE